MDAELESLFSPASNAIVARLLPTKFLEMLEHGDGMMVRIDVKDAVLTVKQETPTIVKCLLADGETRACGLGRVLPGQRDGSLLWHRNITALMKNELNMTPHAPCPCILKSEDNSCFVLIHVDDILAVGRREFVNKLVKCLRSKYEVSTLVMEKPGDELQFLKRRVVLQHDYIQTYDTNTSQTR